MPTVEARSTQAKDSSVISGGLGFKAKERRTMKAKAKGTLKPLVAKGSLKLETALRYSTAAIDQLSEARMAAVAPAMYGSTAFKGGKPHLKD